jgi:hypothetical protein
MSLTGDAARKLSALGASKGGRARAASLTPEERSRIARSGANARWGKKDAGIPRSRREYAIVTPEVKSWMDSDPRVSTILAGLCARPDREQMLERIGEMVSGGS